MNFIENGSFESGDLSHWQVPQGDPESIEFKPYGEGHVVRLQGGTLIAQDLTAADQINPSGTYTLRVTVRAEPSANAIVMLNAIFADELGNQRAHPVFFVADSALKTREFPIELKFEHPVALGQMTFMVGGPAALCRAKEWTVNVWATGFELIAAP